MHLAKKGTTYIGNTHKYFSRDQALDRLESATHYFLDMMGMRNLTHLSETYREMSLKDKELYDAALRRIEKWLAEMNVTEEPENVKAQA